MDNQKNIAADAVICGDCIIQGNVTIGAKTIIHPKVSIIAEDGPIVIGENNIIEELSTIINKNGKLNKSELTLSIGSNNVIQVGCSHIGVGVKVENHCMVGAMCAVNGPLILEDQTVIYGRPAQKRLHDSRIQPQSRQIDLLTKLLPKYHMTSQRPST